LCSAHERALSKPQPRQVPDSRLRRLPIPHPLLPFRPLRQRRVPFGTSLLSLREERQKIRFPRHQLHRRPKLRFRPESTRPRGRRTTHLLRHPRRRRPKIQFRPELARLRRRRTNHLVHHPHGCRPKIQFQPDPTRQRVCQTIQRHRIRRTNGSGVGGSLIGSKMSVYTDPLSWSGQFAHCALPLRLDSYRGCGFSCSYCFARLRGGNSPERQIVPADPKFLSRAFERASGGSPSITAQAIRQRVPIHFGGMSDAFQPAERHHRVTLAFLRTLSEHKYPTLLSTKGELAGHLEYMSELISNPYIILQVSLVSTLDHNAYLIEPSSTPPSRLLRMMEKLSKFGVIVTCRLQPFLEGIGGSLDAYVSTVASTGARQISIEHLKVPVENTNNPTVEAARTEYRRSGARRDGREYVLPSQQKREALFLMKAACKKSGVYFGCADNEFQYTSDSWACCSGADLFPGFENFYRYQISFAVRKSLEKEIRISSIADEWRPAGSIDRYLNSKTRLGERLGRVATVEQHIRYRWNSPTAPGSPLSFAGVQTTERCDDDGAQIYKWEPGFSLSPSAAEEQSV
jgi:DNA repair photolyase